MPTYSAMEPRAPGSREALLPRMKRTKQARKAATKATTWFLLKEEAKIPAAPGGEFALDLVDGGRFVREGGGVEEEQVGVADGDDVVVKDAGVDGPRALGGKDHARWIELMQARDRRIFDWCFTRRLPCAFAMGGGYGSNIQTTLQVQANTYAVALEYWQRWQG